MVASVRHNKTLVLGFLFMVALAFSSCQRGKFQAKNEPTRDQSLTDEKPPVKPKGSFDGADGADGPANEADTGDDDEPNSENDADENKDEDGDDDDSRTDEDDPESEIDGGKPSDGGADGAETARRLIETINSITSLRNPNSTPGSGGDTPLVLDWNQDGKIYSNAAKNNAKVWFDVDDDGKLELVDWVSPEEAILALDLNGNGQIDSGRELFGNATAFIGSKDKAANGFDALAQYDDNRDGQITVADKVFDKLVLWIDANANGTTDPGELIPVSKTTIVSLSVRYAKARIKSGPASEIREIASYTLSDGKTYLLADMHFFPQKDLAAHKAAKTHSKSGK